ncbi:dipeptidyl peptidase 2-like [Acanthaster planci]|uniref:Dipeptidyl peptidase 2-like n=1 Tax=Acanthaster planci TaxID=133434 RepID=A0A8B7YTE0_ACAPL|nr:dipeptidyl peptidase 2-like [Acanthaster planci]
MIAKDPDLPYTVFQSGLNRISNAFRLCKPLKSQDQVLHLLLWIRNSLSTLTTVNYPYPASFEGDLPAWPVNVSCELITNATDALHGLANGAILFYNGTHGSLKCADIYGEFMECSDATGCGSEGWDYQVCTEVTRPAGTNGVTDMFPVLPFTEQMREEYCLKKWNVVPKPTWLSVQMFGNDLSNTSSNIFFSNGAIDPWRGGGVLRNPNPDRYKTLLIPGAAHHLDLRGKNKDDSEAVKKAREQEVAAISQWIH